MVACTLEIKQPTWLEVNYGGSLCHTRARAEGRVGAEPTDLTVVEGEIPVYLDERTFVILPLLLVVV